MNAVAGPSAALHAPCSNATGAVEGGEAEPGAAARRTGEARLRLTGSGPVAAKPEPSTFTTPATVEIPGVRGSPGPLPVGMTAVAGPPTEGGPGSPVVLVAARPVGQVVLQAGRAGHAAVAVRVARARPTAPVAFPGAAGAAHGRGGSQDAAGNDAAVPTGPAITQVAATTALAAPISGP